jgi:hypothetical protein
VPAPAAGEQATHTPHPAEAGHPDVIRDINTDAEAQAEVDEMAQEQAAEVLRSRQNSITGEPKLKQTNSVVSHSERMGAVEEGTGGEAVLERSIAA